MHCQNGGIGRHKGLKIPRLNKLYGFNPRFWYKAGFPSPEDSAFS